MSYALRTLTMNHNFASCRVVPQVSHRQENIHLGWFKYLKDTISHSIWFSSTLSNSLSFNLCDPGSAYEMGVNIIFFKLTRDRIFASAIIDIFIHIPLSVMLYISCTCVPSEHKKFMHGTVHLRTALQHTLVQYTGTCAKLEEGSIWP